MDEFESLSHSRWECKYHVVFIPKGRRKALFGQLRPYLGEVLRRLAAQKESRIEEGHLMSDHVHMMISRGSQASIDRSSSIPRPSAKRAKSAIEASTMRTARDTTQVRRRKRASQCRWREWSRSMPWVASLPTNSRPCGISSA